VQIAGGGSSTTRGAAAPAVWCKGINMIKCRPGRQRQSQPGLRPIWRNVSRGGGAFCRRVVTVRYQVDCLSSQRRFGWPWWKAHFECPYSRKPPATPVRAGPAETYVRPGVGRGNSNRQRQLSQSPTELRPHTAVPLTAVLYVCRSSPLTPGRAELL